MCSTRFSRLPPALCVHALFDTWLQPHQTVYYLKSVVCKRVCTCKRRFKCIGVQTDINSVVFCTILQVDARWALLDFAVDVALSLRPHPLVTWLQKHQIVYYLEYHMPKKLQMQWGSNGHQFGCVLHHFASRCLMGSTRCCRRRRCLLALLPGLLHGCNHVK